MIEDGPYKTGHPKTPHIYHYDSVVSDNTTLTIQELNWFAYRVILVRPLRIVDNPNSTCLLRIRTQSTQALRPKVATPSKHDVLDEAVGNFPQWFVLWQNPQLLSWREADILCGSIGGHLPTIRYAEDVGNLEDVVWGRTNAEDLFMAPCRAVSPECQFFIGLDLFRVCYLSVNLLCSI